MKREIIANLVCDVQKWNPAHDIPDSEFRYIDLSAVCQKNKTINSVANIRGRDAPSRARQKLTTDDVIISTVRPNLNSVAYVEKNFDSDTGSTGFCVLRSDKTKLNPRYLFHWLRTKPFIDDMTRQATGASYPAVTDKIIKNAKIPLFPLKEQKRIASILDAAIELKQKRQRSLELIDELKQSVFIDMFGDPLVNSKNLLTKKLEDYGTIERGKSKHRPRNDPLLLDGPHPLIQTGDVSNAADYITTFKSSYSDFGLAQSRMWKSGTLCITIAANIADTAILKFDACFPDSVVGFIGNSNSETLFIHYWFKLVQDSIEAVAPQSAQKNINLRILRELNVLAPKTCDIDNFAQKIMLIDKAREGILNSQIKISELFNSLQQKAFSGELSGAAA